MRHCRSRCDTHSHPFIVPQTYPVPRSITDIGLKAIKPRAKRFAQHLGGGLYIQVYPTGKRRFFVRCYLPRAVKIMLPADTTLAEARWIAAEIRAGRDPEGHSDITLRNVTEAYFQREGDKLRGAADRKGAIKRLVYPTLGDRPISQIRRGEIVRLFDKISDDRGPVMSDRTLAYLRKIMNWDAVRDDTFRSPLVKGMARTKNNGRNRSWPTTNCASSGKWPTRSCTRSAS